jgi:hypothetical protein
MTRLTLLVPVRCRDGTSTLPNEFFYHREGACRRLKELGDEYKLRRAVLLIDDEEVEHG